MENNKIIVLKANTNTQEQLKYLLKDEKIDRSKYLKTLILDEYITKMQQELTPT